MRKIISILLIAAMVLTDSNLTVFASEGMTDSTQEAYDTMAAESEEISEPTVSEEQETAEEVIEEEQEEAEETSTVVPPRFLKLCRMRKIRKTVRNQRL